MELDIGALVSECQNNMDKKFSKTGICESHLSEYQVLGHQVVHVKFGGRWHKLP